MQITLTGLTGVIGKAKALENPIFAKPMMGDIGMFAMGKIKKRTIAGEDVNGLNSKPYNPMYAKERQKSGYKKTPVDLTRTGFMLSSMTYSESRSAVNIFFMNTSDENNVRNPAKAFWNNEDREFFGLSTSDIKGIMSIVHSYYNKLIRK